MANRRRWIGLLFWLTAVGLVVTGAKWLLTPKSSKVGRELGRYLAGRRATVAIRLPGARRLAVGDPILVREGGELRQVGEVLTLLRDGTQLPVEEDFVTEAVVQFYPDAPLVRTDTRLTLYETPDTLAWVVSTLLPEQRQSEVSRVLEETFRDHRSEIVRTLRPVVEEALWDALAVVRDDFPGALAQHGDTLDRLGKNYQRDVLERQLLPIVKQEIWPVVQAEAEPIAVSIGWELWNRVSLWRFGWRMTYDWLPMTERQMVRKEWQRFLREDARPVLDNHQDELLELVRRSAVTIAENERVQEVLGRSLSQLLADPEFQAMVVDLFNDLVVHNPRLRESMLQRWHSPDTQAALNLVSSRLEPAAERIGQIVLGSIEEGLTDEFVQVLRARVLAKDQRWLLLETRVGGQGSRDVKVDELQVTLASARYRQAQRRPAIHEDVEPEPFDHQLVAASPMGD